MFSRKNVIKALALTAAIAIYIGSRETVSDRIHTINNATSSQQPVEIVPVQHTAI